MSITISIGHLSLSLQQHIQYSQRLKSHWLDMFCRCYQHTKFFLIKNVAVLIVWLMCSCYLVECRMDGDVLYSTLLQEQSWPRAKRQAGPVVFVPKLYFIDFSRNLYEILILDLGSLHQRSEAQLRRCSTVLCCRINSIHHYR